MAFSMKLVFLMIFFSPHIHKILVINMQRTFWTLLFIAQEVITLKSPEITLTYKISEVMPQGNPVGGLCFFFHSEIIYFQYGVKFQSTSFFSVHLFIFKDFLFPIFK